MKRKVIGFVLLLLFGAVRLPYEIHLQKLQRAEGFNSALLNLTLRQQVGQMSFMAALSGFRSLVGVVLYLDAYDAWQRVEWSRMAGLFQTVTTLQPKSSLYWDMAGWHMAYNASIAALEDKAQPSEILRQRKAREYWDVGRKFYEDGLRNNPDNSDLWARYGDLLRDKYEDHLAAAHAYEAAAAKPNARPYLKRMAAYQLAEVPGEEKAAYSHLKALYDLGPGEQTPGLINVLKRLEEKLGIPLDQRIKGTNAH